MKILLVEDNISIKNGLKFSFEENNYQFEHSNNVDNTKEYLKSNTPDLIILDVTLPDGNGFELYKETIKEKQIPTIFLTAKDDEKDIVQGLELGAEDYITKPFSTKELLIRVKKILLRNNKETKITIKDITFDLESMRITKNSKELELTALELKILQYLIINKDKTVTRDALLDKIWELTGNDVDDHTLTVYIKRIKDKIDTDIIKTIKGIGYRIDGK